MLDIVSERFPGKGSLACSVVCSATVEVEETTNPAVKREHSCLAAGVLPSVSITQGMLITDGEDGMHASRCPFGCCQARC